MTCITILNLSYGWNFSIFFWNSIRSACFCLIFFNKNKKTSPTTNHIYFKFDAFYNQHVHLTYLGIQLSKLQLKCQFSNREIFFLFLCSYILKLFCCAKKYSKTILWCLFLSISVNVLSVNLTRTQLRNMTLLIHRQKNVKRII